MNIMDVAKLFYDAFRGGPRFYVAEDDPSFLLDVNNQWCIWDRVGFRLDEERTLALLTARPSPVEAVMPALDDNPTYWHKEGYADATIAHFGLGHFPDPEMGDCWAIPIRDVEGRVVQYSYRVEKVGKEEKRYYALPPTLRVELFRAERGATKAWLNGMRKAREMAIGGYKESSWTSANDCHNASEPIIVAGEKKAIRLWQEGFTAYSSTGGYAFPWRWLPFFRQFKRVYVLLDPFEMWAAMRIARMIGPTAYVATLPIPVDEWFKAGGTPTLFREWLGRAMPMSPQGGMGEAALRAIPDRLWWPQDRKVILDFEALAVEK